MKAPRYVSELIGNSLLQDTVSDKSDGFLHGHLPPFR